MQPFAADNRSDPVRTSAYEYPRAVFKTAHNVSSERTDPAPQLAGGAFASHRQLCGDEGKGPVRQDVAPLPVADRLGGAPQQPRNREGSTELVDNFWDRPE